MQDIYNLNKFEIIHLMEKQLFPVYRSEQIWRYLYKNEVETFDEMKNISSKVIDYLKQNYFIGSVRELRSIVSKDKSTYKSLFSLSDGLNVESVLMNYPSDDHRKPRKTICISSQVGCALGCTFCATGQQ